MADEREKIRMMMGLSPAKDPVIMGGTPFGQAGSLPPGAITGTPVGSQSAVSGLTVTGSERNAAKEKEALDLGYSQQYIASRGGINSQGYFNDTPLSGQLTAAEQRQVTLPNGRTDTTAMAGILIKKQYDEAIAQGGIPQLVIQKLKSQWGNLFDSSGLPQPKVAEDGGTTITDTGITGIGAVNTGANMTGISPAVQAQISALQAQLNAQQTQAQTQAAAAAAAETAKRESVGKIVAARFAQYGLSTLGAKVLELAKQGYNEDTITLELQNSEEYKIRFAANEERLKKGLSVLTPAEYLSVEDAYRQTLRAYGLTQFDNDAYVKQFIANDVSPTELSNRVVTAVQRVQNADPAVAQTLRDYYGIGQTDMVAYVLDPNQKLQEIQRKVAASEIGVAARRQGLEAGVSVAEQLAAQGVTQAEAQKGYATIADILPTAQKLSDIYGTTIDGYGQAEAEQEVFNQLASAQRKRQALTSREIAAFGGSSGMAKSSLKQSTGGQI